MKPILKTYSRQKKPCVLYDTEYNFLKKEDVLLCCRGCLATDRRLFNIHDHNLADALAHITGTPIFKDELPQHLCSYCCRLLLKCESFRDMCLHTQQSLTAELQTGSLDLDVVRGIYRPFNQYIDLSLCEVDTVQCIDSGDPLDDADMDNDGKIKEEPETLIDIDIISINDIKKEVETAVCTDGAINVYIEEEPEINSVGLNSIEEKSERVVGPDRTINDVIEKEPVIKILGLDGIINKTDSKAEFETQKRFLNVSVDKPKYIQNVIKLRKIGNALQMKKEMTIKNVNNKSNMSKTNAEEIKRQLKAKQAKVKNTIVKKKKKIGDKSKNDDEPTELRKVERRGRKRRERLRKFRSADNDNMPVFDFAAFERECSVKIVTLTKEEQLEEIAARKKSRNYLESPFKCEECGKGFNSEPTYSDHRKRHSPNEGDFPCEICGIRYKKNCQKQRHQDVHRLKLMCNKCDFVSRDRQDARLHHAIHAGKTFECQHCGKTFKKRSSYFAHVRWSHSKLTVACDECGETFVSQNGLKMHKTRAHAKNPHQFKCTTCSAVFNSVEALNRHTDTAGEHSELRPCEQCGENCASETELQEHVKEKHPKETYDCKECGMAFPSAAATELHHRRKHLGKGPKFKKLAWRYQRQQQKPPSGVFVCEQCGHIAKSEVRLEYHQRTHLEVKPFACDLCPKTFTLKSLLQMHLRSHTGEKPYQCADCPLAFSLKSNLSRHHKTAHQGIKDNVACPICGRLLAHKYSIRLHINTVHLGQPGPKRDRSKTLKRKRIETESDTDS